ncbi:hypothetical protein TRAPUB_117 [Trametes pubescens]|uniref:DUF6533 domain-containing protein n=1 Tax=Trametes pubescens TaxID=154538 RepID=A0A1M2VN31_TRAPU|nr:hypothetical protein TRAPUB_117 [Trametes pubescens]
MSNPLGTTAIIAFEYILTLGQEIDYFWRGKFTGASVLFFLTRYLAVLVNVIETSGFANITPKGTQQFILGVYDPIVGCEGAATYSVEFAKQLTAVLIARFLLDLQATNRSALDACESSDDAEAGAGAGAGGGFPSPGSLVFERFVGSLASSVTQSRSYTEAQ